MHQFIRLAVGCFVLAVAGIGNRALAQNTVAHPVEVMATTVKYHIGTVEECQAPTALTSQDSLTTSLIAPGPGGCLWFRCFIPDDLAGHCYDFEIAANGQTLQRRGGQTSGMGLRSFFVPWPEWLAPQAQRVTLTLTNHSRETLWVETLKPLPNFEQWQQTPLPANDFALCLKVRNYPDEDKENLFAEVDKLTSAPGVRNAVSAELHYARRSPEQLTQALGWLRSKCDERRMPFLATVCAWWAGTPREVVQRLDFQQICWSETDTVDEGEGLKQLLGKSWDLRYGLSTPNRWNNVPWQTLNNPELNALRRERMTSCVKLIEQEMAQRLIGYVSENEPAYWAGKGENDRYPVERKNLWADFNPHTVAAARNDGVELDPRDGLSIRERLWLHQNLARYMQASCDTLTSAGVRTPVYSHALLSLLFPMQGTGYFHPYAEVARVRGARTGLETLWRTDEDGLWRVREWGRWGCVNREENDSFSMEYHVAMLAMHYMMGADVFNSYNWQRVNENGRAIGYFNEFLNMLAGSGVVVAGGRISGDAWRSADKGVYPLSVRAEFPWANSLCLRLRAGEAASGSPLTVWLTQGVSGPTIAYRKIMREELGPETTFTCIRFGDITHWEQDNTVAMLHMEAAPGWEVYCSDDGPDYRLQCELRSERRRAQFVMQATTPASVLSHQHLKW